MKFKKGVRKLAILSAISMILGGNVVSSFADEISAYAGNTTDSSYQFEFGLLNGSEDTPGRAKKDTSKTYMKCNVITSGYNYTAKVYASLGGGNYVDASKGTKYTFSKGSHEYMTNNVRGLGYTAAAVKANSGINSKVVTAAGVWSPDSTVK